MMHTFNAILLILFQLNGWELLSTVTLTRVYDEMMGQEVDQPAFNQEILAREGTEMTLTGYVIPLEAGTEQSYFVLSRFPYQSCFFCGAAGPETVAEIYPAELQSKLNPDQRIEVTGTLKLNQSDPLHLYFILKEATIKLL